MSRRTKLRPANCSRNVLSRAHGSSSWYQGETKVLAAPKAGKKRNENPEQAHIEVLWRMTYGQNGKRSR